MIHHKELKREDDDKRKAEGRVGAREVGSRAGEKDNDTDGG